MNKSAITGLLDSETLGSSHIRHRIERVLALNLRHLKNTLRAHPAAIS